MNKHIFIVNPASGNGKATEFIYNLEMYAKEDNLEHEIIIEETEGKGCASSIAYAYSEVFEDSIIYSVGGDGTLNEVINGINPNAKLAIIPAGSGNDFYRIYKNIGETKTIDLGVVNGRKFINIASLGLDAKMANRANQIKNNSILPMLCYPRAILRELINYKPIEISINGEYKKCTLFAVCNGKYYGNGFPINPNYDLNNGILNMISADKLSRREIIIMLLKLMKEEHLNFSKVNCMFKDNVVLESNQEILCNVDGEIISGKKFEFGTIKEGLTLTTNVPQYVKRAIKTIK